MKNISVILSSILLTGALSFSGCGGGGDGASLGSTPISSTYNLSPSESASGVIYTFDGSFDVVWAAYETYEKIKLYDFVIQVDGQNYSVDYSKEIAVENVTSTTDTISQLIDFKFSQTFSKSNKNREAILTFKYKMDSTDAKTATINYTLNASESGDFITEYKINNLSSKTTIGANGETLYIPIEILEYIGYENDKTDEDFDTVSNTNFNYYFANTEAISGTSSGVVTTNNSGQANIEFTVLPNNTDSTRNITIRFLLGDEMAELVFTQPSLNNIGEDSTNYNITYNSDIEGNNIDISSDGEKYLISGYLRKDYLEYIGDSTQQITNEPVKDAIINVSTNISGVNVENTLIETYEDGYFEISLDFDENTLDQSKEFIITLSVENTDFATVLNFTQSSYDIVYPEYQIKGEDNSISENNFGSLQVPYNPTTQEIVIGGTVIVANSNEFAELNGKNGDATLQDLIDAEIITSTELPNLQWKVLSDGYWSGNTAGTVNLDSSGQFSISLLTNSATVMAGQEESLSTSIVFILDQKYTFSYNITFETNPDNE